ncbi:hypothetical protein NPIL_555311 [Nephila pilipes]|uniref:Uncharacterized protein n=1 Tax=Nephila pilipes TaxID=299642 RepID=A0A8X6TVG4_NEPPI|nr:hypothetical protein NPIL_555311 [Nephila pilipes]
MPLIHFHVKAAKIQILYKIERDIFFFFSLRQQGIQSQRVPIHPLLTNGLCSNLSVFQAFQFLVHPKVIQRGKEGAQGVREKFPNPIVPQSTFGTGTLFPKVGRKRSLETVGTNGICEE